MWAVDYVGINKKSRDTTNMSNEQRLCSIAAMARASLILMQ